MRAWLGSILLLGSLVACAVGGLPVAGAVLACAAACPTGSAARAGCLRAYRWLTSAIVGGWEAWVGALLEAVYGVRVRVTGSLPLLQERAVLIANHRTRLDWAMLWPVLARATVGAGGGSAGGALRCLHIVLKLDLKQLPFLGWATGMARFVFLSRRWAADAPHLRAMLALVRWAARADGAGYLLLLFPEGTDLSPARAAQTAAYGTAHGLPALEQTLHPRVRGLEATVEALRGGGGGGGGDAALDALYDATLAYRGRVVNEGGFLSGAGPSEIHVHLTRHAAADLPRAGPPFEAWLRARFAEKEAALRRFYADEGLSLPVAMGAAAIAVAEARSSASAATRTYAFGAAVVAACTAVAVAAAVALGPLRTTLACLALHGVHLAVNAWLGGADRVELRLSLPSEAAAADAEARRGPAE